MLSKFFKLFKSAPVEVENTQEVSQPLVKLGPEKTETPVTYEMIESPTTQQLEDAFKEEVAEFKEFEALLESIKDVK